MANIQPYDAGVPAIRPSETGVESAAAAGRRLGSFYSQIAEGEKETGREIGRALGTATDAAVNYQTHHQVNAGNDNASKLFLDTTQNLNDTMAKAPAHQGAATFQQWREQYLEPKLNDFANSGFFTTAESQKWANDTVNHYRQHFFVQGQSEVMRLAKDDVGVSVDNQTNNFRNAAFINPAGGFDIMKQVGTNMEATLAANPGMTGVDAANFRTNVTEKVKKEVANAMIMGTISKGGDWQKLAADPRLKGYVDDVEMAKYERQDRYYTRIAESENKHLEAQQKVDDKQASQDTEKKILNSLIPTDNAPPPTAGELHGALRDYGTMNGTTGARLNAMSKTVDNYVKHLNDPDRATQKATYDGLAAQLTDPTRPLTIHDVVDNAENLSTKAKKDLVWSIKALQTEDMKDPMLANALHGARQMIQGSGIERQMQAGKYAEFVNSFLPEYYREKRAGTLPKDVDPLDLSKPESMISKAMTPYRSRMVDIMTGNGGGAPPAVPTYTAPTVPKVGEVRDGWTFKGGNPGDPNSWSK